MDHEYLMLCKFSCFYLIQLLLSSACLDYLHNHDCYIDCNHYRNADCHGVAHVKLVLGTLVVPSETHEVVDLNDAEEVVDCVNDVVYQKDEASGTIEVDNVEHTDQQEQLQLLGWVVYQHYWYQKE
jgi:hypothetical protein